MSWGSVPSFFFFFLFIQVHFLIPSKRSFLKAQLPWIPHRSGNLSALSKLQWVACFSEPPRTGSEGGGTYRTWLQSWLNQHELHWRKTGVLLYRKTNSCFLGFHACKFQTHASLLNINLLIGKCFLIKKKVFYNSTKHQSNESMPTANNLSVTMQSEHQLIKTELSV